MTPLYTIYMPVNKENIQLFGIVHIHLMRGDCILVGGGDLLKEGRNNVCCTVSPPPSNPSKGKPCLILEPNKNVIIKYGFIVFIRTAQISQTQQKKFIEKIKNPTKRNTVIF